MDKQTETIDKLFLELSQFTQAKTESELHLEDDLFECQKQCAEQKEITMQAVRDRNEALNELLINRVNMAVLSNRADRAEETARVLAAELEAMRKEAP